MKLWPLASSCLQRLTSAWRFLIASETILRSTPKRFSQPLNTTNGLAMLSGRSLTEE